MSARSIALPPRHANPGQIRVAARPPSRREGHVPALEPVKWPSRVHEGGAPAPARASIAPIVLN